ncbi:MAG: right-handed parallel beta-helix repeat-containing protein [Solirubrobacterales bacterium]
MGLLTVTLALALSATGYAATPSCDLYASPTGSDSAAGSLEAPLRTVQRLADSLSPGQVGCLREGVFEGSGEAGDPFRELKITRPEITLTSAPGEQATVSARLWIARGADGVTVSNLDLDGANSRDLPSPTVNADGAVFRHDDVTNGHTSICFALGSPVWGRAGNTLIEENRIHGCGQLPSTNQEHGIYLSAADDTVIRGNWIYDNADRGIQMYPDAQRTVITGNVIYGNGEGLIFSGDQAVASSGARVSGNVIAGSRIRRNVESYYSGNAPIGTDNLVRSNCIHGAPGGYYGGSDGSGVQSPQVGFTATGNVNRDPEFRDASAADFRLAPGSACAAVLDPATDDSLPGPSAGDAPAATPPWPPASPPATTATPPPAAARPATASGSRRGVTLKAARHRGRRGSRVLLEGRVKGAVAVASKARIYARRDRRWRPVAIARVTGPGSFRARAPLFARGRVARLQARVAGAGSSRVVLIRVV